MPEKKSITVTVYGLASSEDGKLRYIGQTTGALDRRLIHHRYDAKKLSTIHKSNWIRSVIERGFEIVIFPIECNAPWGTAEQRLIALHRKNGVDLVNTTDGGEGVVGYVRDAEWRAARSALMKGRTSPRKGMKSTDATRAKISAAQLGKAISLEQRAKISKKLTGRKQSPEHTAAATAARKLVPRAKLSMEHKEKLRQLNIGRKHSPESIAKMSAVQRGRTFTPEALAKMSAVRRGRPWSQLRRERYEQRKRS